MPQYPMLTSPKKFDCSLAEILLFTYFLSASDGEIEPAKARAIQLAKILEEIFCGRENVEGIFFNEE